MVNKVSAPILSVYHNLGVALMTHERYHALFRGKEATPSSEPLGRQHLHWARTLLSIVS